MTVKLDGKLPESGSPANGLDHMQQQILRRPKETLIAVVVLRCETVEVKPQSGAQHPRMAIEAIEVMQGGASLAAFDMMQLSATERTGQQEIRYFEGYDRQLHDGLLAKEFTETEADEKMPRSDGPRD